MTKAFSFDVFLSYNSADKAQVRRMAQRLKDAGLRVWFDEWTIRPGDDIYLAIERGKRIKANDIKDRMKLCTPLSIYPLIRRPNWNN